MILSVTCDRLEGTLTAPSSKSVSVRAALIGALTEDKISLYRYSSCADARSALNAAKLSGANILQSGETVTLEGNVSMPAHTLYCGESALTLRLFAAAAALKTGVTKLTAQGTLARRPTGLEERVFSALGAHLTQERGVAPVWVKGPMTGGEAVVSGNLTSEVISGLCLSLPLAPRNSRLMLSSLVSRPYVSLTLEMMRRQGVMIHVNHEMTEIEIPGKQKYAPFDISVEGDWSSAAFLCVAGVLSGEITIKNLSMASLQPDKKILEIIEAAGGEIIKEKEGVTCRSSNLSPFCVDLTDAPDLYLPCLALAARINGTSLIYGTNRQHAKESDRAEKSCQLFSLSGVKVEIQNNVTKITGSRLTAPPIYETFGDHRLAMALTVAYAGTGQTITLNNAECVAKSYPEFFKDIETAGGKIKKYDSDTGRRFYKIMS